MRRATVVDNVKPVPLSLVAHLNPLVLGQFHIAELYHFHETGEFFGLGVTLSDFLKAPRFYPDDE
jgi:hypothetical protein